MLGHASLPLWLFVSFVSCCARGRVADFYSREKNSQRQQQRAGVGQVGGDARLFN